MGRVRGLSFAFGMVRKGDARPPLKEKVVAIYELLFQVGTYEGASCCVCGLIEDKGKDPSVNQASFWGELFLLRPNIAALDSLVALTPEDRLLQLSPLLQTFFQHALLALQDRSPIRRAYSIEVSLLAVKPHDTGSLVLSDVWRLPEGSVPQVLQEHGP